MVTQRAAIYAASWAVVNAVFVVAGVWSSFAGALSLVAVALSFALRAILEGRR